MIISHAQIAGELEALERGQQEADEATRTASAREAAATKRCAELEEQMATFKDSVSQLQQWERQDT